MDKNCTPEEVLTFAVRIGDMMLKSGAETYRVEDTIIRILSTSDFKTTETFVTPTGIMATLGNDPAPLYTKVCRIKNRSTRFDKIERLNQLSRDYVSGILTTEEAMKVLDSIEATPPYPAWLVIAMIGISCAFLSFMFNGTWIEFLLTLPTGIVIGLIQYRLKLKGIINYLSIFVCSVFIGLMAIAYGIIFDGILHQEPFVIACIMPLLPGVAFTNAVRDTIGDELISGISRGVEALFIAIAIAAGISVGMRFGIYLGGLL
ncbi:MAG: threonine/serine exporter ThrE family protein [Cellulosilyticaceae bacterium]